MRSRRPRGEASRHAILDATLELIARHGIHAVTHRAIAAEAGVALASTTYFFASLPDLIEQAFDLYVEQAATANAQVLERAAALVATTGAADRGQLHERLTELAIEFMRGELRERPRGLAVEVQFLSLVRPPPPLAHKVATYRERLVAGIEAVLAPYSDAPATDASLLLGAIHRLELEGLRAAQSLPEALVRAELGRLLALILPLPDAAPPGADAPPPGAAAASRT